jgi:ATP-dependent Lon protease
MPETIDLPVLPLVDDVVLPGMVAPLTLDAEAQAAVDAAQSASDSRLLLVPRLDGGYTGSGVLAVIEQVGRLPSGEPAVVVRGLQRAKIGSGVSGAGAALWVQATVLEDSAATGRTRELASAYKSLVVSILQQRGAWQVIDNVQRMNDPSTLADTAGYAPYLDSTQKLWLLETTDVDARLERLTEWGREHLAELEVSGKIRDDVREGMEKNQREFLLRQQLAAIRKELGEDEPDGADDYRGRVESADLPEKVREAAMREVGKLERGSDQSPEAGWIRTWLDTVLELPWGVRTTDTTDISGARAVLDADHEGLDDVKDRIVEHLAVRARRAERPGDRLTQDLAG